ncbi:MULTISPECIES: tRNA uracil 4-sulfurtransferase ThiI [Aerococcus]|uniref:tRNA uracil 4-sulfurtransferase ThiI n=1 Tax=Aerococcus TaxID=1375 RepID=UPI00227C5ED2|nr:MULTISPECIES: tRNA uracil 4-sulfurtransferase ThiI [Aerococcus]MCY3036563.1 tRNA 4-thiouridine(8) synthase ThiI [Aerococcus sp. Group 2]MCY3039524.1 tRNA 4-thiouridine(8) synthase ThiI [Aerococcus sp. Group 2]MCY3041426.1 tRNA 4-thiouridine(8) synthase ThiI [Aerococcus sp. Group 2]MCY3042978.1 tRNA 4-thiouridine(8) synthase ThiI [Aerococcus sp. Group 2]MDK6520619.1 tRNA uracil 4-sulfurtransferase ThiI [Aerococcus urinae]
METKIMIRYGELSVKGKNKRRFINRLAENIRQIFSDYPQVKVSEQFDFMFIELNGVDKEIVIDRLQYIFGIQSYSPVYEIDRDFDLLKEVAKQVVKEKLDEREIHSFKVATSRSDHNYHMDTNAINRELGAYLMEEFPNLEVKMKKPDLTVRVKVRFKDFVVSSDWIKGIGGLPVGTSSRGILMLSGGIDSPVAGYLAMKRGVRPIAIHFASPPYTSPQALEKAKQLAGKLTKFGSWIDFIEVPFTEIQEAIKEHIPSEYLMTITRRMMLRVADRIREKYHALSIINGESLGQVASQTAESMYAINAVTTTPIIRPVVTMDKLEIIDIAQAIDTFDLSIQPFEDCCTVFAPASPSTKPKVDRCEHYESRLDIDTLVDNCLAKLNFERIDHHSLEKSNAQEEAMDDLL